MFQAQKVTDELRPILTTMFDALGEPPQVLTTQSPHPLVVHHVMGQITFVAAGTGLASLAGHTLELNPGDLFIMSPGCEHAFLCQGDDLHLRHWHWPQALLETDRTVLVEAFVFPSGAASDSATDHGQVESGQVDHITAPQ